MNIKYLLMPGEDAELLIDNINKTYPLKNINDIKERVNAFCKRFKDRKLIMFLKITKDYLYNNHNSNYDTNLYRISMLTKSCISKDNLNSSGHIEAILRTKMSKERGYNIEYRYLRIKYNKKLVKIQFKNTDYDTVNCSTKTES